MPLPCIAQPQLDELRRLQQVQQKELRAVRQAHARLQRQVDRLQNDLGKEMGLVRRETAAIANGVRHQANAMWVLQSSMDMVARKLGVQMKDPPERKKRRG